MNGDELERRRHALGMSQTELGERIGIRQPTISAWEQGKKPIGHPLMLALALWALERHLDDVRTWERHNETTLGAEERWLGLDGEPRAGLKGGGDG